MLQRFAKSVYSSFLLQGTQHEQLQTKYHQAQDYHAIGSHYRPCKNWQFSGSMNVTSITSICNFPAPIKSFVSKTRFVSLGPKLTKRVFETKLFIGAVSRPKFVLHQYLHLVVHTKAVKWSLLKKIHASPDRQVHYQVKCFPASYTRFKIQYDSNEGTMCLSALHSYLIGFDVHGLKSHYLFTLWVIGDWRSMLGWRLVVSIVLTCVTTL